jgi:hypothetical protein
MPNSETSGWISCAIKTTAPWPEVQREIKFRAATLVLKPETDTVYPLVQVELSASLNSIAAHSTVRAFLSALCWATGQAAFVLWSTWSRPLPLNIGKSNVRYTGLGWFDYLADPVSDDARLALALYREATSIEYVPFKVLSYFRILNMVGSAGRQQMAWINANLSKLVDREAKERLKELTSLHLDVGEYLYAEARCAVAHASVSAENRVVVNPDDPADELRMALDLPLVRALARHYIVTEHGILTEREFHDLHLYELEGFRSRLDPNVLTSLKAGKCIGKEHLNGLPKTVSLRLRDRPRLGLFESMASEYHSVGGGLLVATLRQGTAFSIQIGLNFAKEALEVRPQAAKDPYDDGSVDSATRLLDFAKWFGWMMCNGVTELWSGDVRLSRSQAWIGVNIRFDFRRHEAVLAQLQAEVDRRSSSGDDAMARQVAPTEPGATS